jgi:hypothetical protein
MVSIWEGTFMPSCWGDPSAAKYQASIGWRIIAYSVMANNLTRKLILVMRTRKMKNPTLTFGLNYFLFLTPSAQWGWQTTCSLLGLQLAGNQKQITSVIPSFSYTLHLLHNSIVDLVSGGLDPLRLCDSWPTIMQCCCILNTLVQSSFNFSWVLTLVHPNLPAPAWFSPSAIMVLKELRRQGVQGGALTPRRMP